jgi:hypothetical protein
MRTKGANGESGRGRGSLHSPDDPLRGDYPADAQESPHGNLGVGATIEPWLQRF